MSLDPLRLATDGFFGPTEGGLTPESIASIAGAVWDTPLNQHLLVGSTGEKLAATSTLTIGDIPQGLTAAQVWSHSTRTLTTASGLTPEQAIILQQILDQLEADYFKGDDRFTRYIKGTNTVILDKDVSFNPDQGYTVTDRGTVNGTNPGVPSVGLNGLVHWS